MHLKNFRVKDLGYKKFEPKKLRCLEKTSKKILWLRLLAGTDVIKTKVAGDNLLDCYCPQDKYCMDNY